MESKSGLKMAIYDIAELWAIQELYSNRRAVSHLHFSANVQWQYFWINYDQC